MSLRCSAMYPTVWDRVVYGAVTQTSSGTSKPPWLSVAVRWLFSASPPVSSCELATCTPGGGRRRGSPRSGCPPTLPTLRVARELRGPEGLPVKTESSVLGAPPSANGSTVRLLSPTFSPYAPPSTWRFFQSLKLIIFYHVYFFFFFFYYIPELVKTRSP